MASTRDGWPSERRSRSRPWRSCALESLTAPLETNVEFYTALLLEALAIPPSAFTCIFAAGRVAGWTAHAWE
ncbi:MAG: citrate/2-methylcitrate synthase [Phenylobacterium sp.]